VIIDSHTHTGKIAYSVGKNRVSNLPGEDLLAAMKKYSIDFALVSSIESAEFDSWGKLAPPGKQIPQLESFRRLVSFVRYRGNTRSGRISMKALLWIKPYSEKATAALEQFIEENREYIAGFKMHPSLSRLKFTDDRFLSYIELASRLDMPVQVHTENDGFSDIKYLEAVAKEYKDTDFVMVHMGLGTDNAEAVELIKQFDNIYGDTCEVNHANVLEAINKCRSEKILFATDAVVHGIDTYARYMPLVNLIRKTFTGKEADDVLFRNCQRVFEV
jgi:Tat protein secretion system quality control protein TatD with DNase activity